MRVSFCVGKGCCPEAEFEDDKSITLTDERESGRHSIPFSKEQADKLADELVTRGYGADNKLSDSLVARNYTKVDG